MPIRNVIFDIGNVLVPWDPHGIVRTAFGDERVGQPGFRSPLAGNQLWIAVNRGEHTLAEAKNIYVEEQGFAPADIDALYTALMDSMTLMDETDALLRELADAGYRLFAITDNVNEVVALLRERHGFWRYFEAAAVSSELGVLKPDPQMYRHVIESGSLEPGECLFFDDVPANVAGAEAVGMHARLFTDAMQARAELAELGIVL